MLISSLLACRQGPGLATAAVLHLLCLQSSSSGSSSSSSSSASAFASKATAEPPYKKVKPQGASKKNNAADKPPRAVSAYAFFLREQAPARKGEDGLNAPGLLKRIAGDWKALQEHEKQPYVDLAKKSKAEAEQARAEPKRARGPPTAYNIFCKEVAEELRASQQHMTGPNLLREVAARWGALPTVEKEQRKAAAQAATDAWKAQQR